MKDSTDLALTMQEHETPHSEDAVNFWGMLRTYANITRNSVDIDMEVLAGGIHHRAFPD